MILSMGGLDVYEYVCIYQMEELIGLNLSLQSEYKLHTVMATAQEK